MRCVPIQNLISMASLQDLYQLMIMEMLIKEEFDFSNKFGDLHKYALLYGIKKVEEKKKQDTEFDEQLEI